MPSFVTLWSNHPNVNREAPLLDRMRYPNQCAVRLHAALERSGVDFGSFAGLLSVQDGCSGYALRARDLAEWFDSPAAPLHSRAELLTGADVFKRIASETGIVYFRHFWGPGRQGNHIDLWNGRRLTRPRTWLEVHTGVGRLGIGSDYRASEHVWFWRVP